jgi:hypothetical protein
MCVFIAQDHGRAAGTSLKALGRALTYPLQVIKAPKQSISMDPTAVANLLKPHDFQNQAGSSLMYLGGVMAIAGEALVPGTAEIGLKTVATGNALCLAPVFIAGLKEKGLTGKLTSLGVILLNGGAACMDTDIGKGTYFTGVSAMDNFFRLQAHKQAAQQEQAAKLSSSSPDKTLTDEK